MSGLSTNMAETKTAVIASIDFGTTFSGYTFLFHGDTSQFYTDASAEKQPTCVLLNRDTSFNAIGEKAIEDYSYMDTEERKEHFFFRHFKMALYETVSLSRDTLLTDTIGKTLKALTVFARVISYFKQKVVEHLKQAKLITTADIGSGDVTWMLTIPAIWSDSARQFMREAALKAGLPESNLRLVLEPEAASIFCREQPMKLDQNKHVETFETGHKYILADIGGGTLDICVHEVLEGGSLRELHRATGNDAGGLQVNQEFEKMMVKLFGGEAWDRYRAEFPTHFHEFLNRFEVKKRQFSKNVANIKLKIDYEFRQLIEETTGEKMEEAIQQSNYKDIVKYHTGPRALSLSSIAVIQLFSSSVEAVIRRLKQVLADCSAENISTLLLAGGYAESPYLRERIKEDIGIVKVITVTDPRLAVLKGAAIMGLRPMNILQRVARYTYGFGIACPFIQGKHPEALRFHRDGKELCKFVFNKLIECGEPLVYKQRITKLAHGSFIKPESKSMELIIDLFRSNLKDPKYCTKEFQCELAGRIIINPPAEGWPDYLNGERHLIVGETEFTMEFTSKDTGLRYETRLDCL